MAVPGKLSRFDMGSEEFIEIKCQPCKDDGKCTAASGICRQCKEYMCKICFGQHRKAKFCKDHEMADNADMTDVDNSLLEDLEHCPQHFNELTKFYCPEHDQIGCGDCMILGHKMCRVDYIPDKAKEFEGSREFDYFSKDIRSSCERLHQFLPAIQLKRGVVEQVYDDFISETESFKNEILEHINTLAREICGKAADIKSQNMKCLEELEKETTAMAKDASYLKETLEAQRGQPKKLFVIAMMNKGRLKTFEQNIVLLENKNKVDEYTFKRHVHLENVIKTSNRLGYINRSQNKDQIDAEKESSQTETNQVSSEQVKTEPLLDLKLRADDIDICGDCLRFPTCLCYLSNSDAWNRNSLYIGDRIMTTGSYFEVEIINGGGNYGSVGIGLVPKDYPCKNFPGSRKSSAGYHSDDGRVYIESEFGKAFGPPCSDSDRMGCGMSRKTILSVTVYFTRNGKMIVEKQLFTTRDLYPAVALDTPGQEVKVKLDAPPPIL